MSSDLQILFGVLDLCVQLVKASMNGMLDCKLNVARVLTICLFCFRGKFVANVNVKNVGIKNLQKYLISCKLDCQLLDLFPRYCYTF